MTRKRAEIKSKKTLKINKSKVLAVVTIVIIIAISGVAMTLYDSPEDDQKEDNSDGTWLFAMDTAGVGNMYGASSIPTIVIIDPDGNVVYYNQGVISKDQFLYHIELAAQGTADSLGVAPVFTLKTFNDKTFALSEYRGKVVLLDFMAEYCGPCKIQMPELQKVKQEKGDDIVILSIDVLYPQETEKIVRDAFGEYIK